MNFTEQRIMMVQRQIKRRGIASPNVLSALSNVPRHKFVPEDLRPYSYEDRPLKIGHEQTISQPYIVALMLELLKANKGDSVLEIGTGSGYQTALLAEIAKDIYTVERISALLDSARGVLDGMGYENIYYHLGDGTKGWKEAYPEKKLFDRIVVSAAAPSIPPSLTEQLSDNGRLVLPSGSRWMQELIVVIRKGDKLITEKHGGCTFVPLIGEEGWDDKT